MTAIEIPAHQPLKPQSGIKEANSERDSNPIEIPCDRDPTGYVAAKQ